MSGAFSAVPGHRSQEGRLRVVGVVVPAHDEEDMLPACLESVGRAAALARARRPWLRVDVVVALDRCRDTSPAVVTAAPGVRGLVVDAGCVGVARDRGAMAVLAGSAAPAQAVWIAYTDADCEVPPDWLNRHVHAAESGAQALVGTVQVDDWAGRGEHTAVLWAAGYHPTAGHRHVHGANLGVRASALLAVGGVPYLRTGEDEELVHRLDAGYPGRVWRSADCPVRTSARTSARCPDGFASHLDGLDRRVAG